MSHTFQYVLWRPRMRIAADQLKIMSDNQQLMNDDNNAHPSGILGWMSSTADDNATTQKTINSLSMTLDIPANRMIKISFFCPWVFMNGGPAVARTSLQVDGTTVQFTEGYGSSTTGSYMMFGEMSVVVTGLSGSHTIRVRGERVSGTGTPYWNADASSAMQFIVEDIGAEVAES